MLGEAKLVMIYVDSLQEAIKFYEEILQIEVEWQIGNYVGLKNKIVLHNIKDPILQGAIYYHVDDVVNVYNALEAKGVVFIKTPFKSQQGSAAVLEDPFGNKLCIIDNKM